MYSSPIMSVAHSATRTDNRRRPYLARHPASTIKALLNTSLLMKIPNWLLTFAENIDTLKCIKRRWQLELDLKMPARWGGARAGSGRNPGLVTIRVRRGVPSLRSVRLVRELERSFRVSAERANIRVVHYSIQHDHVHLLTEAADAAALGRGMKSIAARLARAVNRVFARRGAVLDGRYHHRELATPREVRAALAYVLLNARKHAAQRVPASVASGFGLDPASSSRWFEGWADHPVPPADRPAVARPRTWLLRAGWRRHGLIRLEEVPGSETSRSRGVS